MGSPLAAALQIDRRRPCFDIAVPCGSRARPCDHAMRDGAKGQVPEFGEDTWHRRGPYHMAMVDASAARGVDGDNSFDASDAVHPVRFSGAQDGGRLAFDLSARSIVVGQVQ